MSGAEGFVGKYKYLSRGTARLHHQGCRMTKRLGDVTIEVPHEALHVRMAYGLVRLMVTFAMGIYAVCALAVAIGWGLEAVLPIEGWADEMDRRAAQKAEDQGSRGVSS